MQQWIAALFAGVFIITSTSAACAETKSVETLIDELPAIASSAPGIDDTETYEAFLADDEAPRFEAGLLPLRPPSVPGPMRELVRRGVAALPALLAHLSDKRPTKIVVGSDDQMATFGGQFFGQEYDPRVGIKCGSDCEPGDENNWFIENPCDAKSCPSFDRKYTVKVGDICEVLVGQIVNRRLSAVRYQPTAIIYVNSPIEQPSLAERIRKDWGGLDARAHEASLLDDLRIHGERFAVGALARLRFYYPRTYAALSGKDLEKRDAFETEEKKRKSE